MSTHKRIDLICVVVIACALILTILFMNGEKLGIVPIVDEDSPYTEKTEHFTSNDLNGSWSTENATKIILEGDTATVSGKGAYALDGNVVIAGAGYYVLEGELSDGSIIVDAYNTSKVWILLNGVSIYCSDDAAFIVDQAEKVFLTLAEGTDNFLESGEEYSSDALSDNTNAAVFAKDDLTINGSGSLTVTAAYRHGIAAKDDLAITGGTICITAPVDGIRVNDSFCFREADLQITAGDEGVVQENPEELFYVESGTITIDSGDDAVNAVSDVVIDGGLMTLNAVDDGVHSDASLTVNGGTVLITKCYEGLEAQTVTLAGGDVTVYPKDDGVNASGSYIWISGGTLTIINQTGTDADGLDSNGDIYISGGDVRISLLNSGSNSAIDYASESGGVCEISGGTVVAAGSSQMAEQFDSTSSQCSILYTYQGGVQSGTTVSVADTEGNVLLTWEVPCSFSAVSLSCPEMTVAETYYVMIGDSQEEITLEEISTVYGDAQQGGFGGMMDSGPMDSGQMQQRPEQGDAPAEEGESDGRQQPAEGEMPSFAEGEMPIFEDASSPEGEAQGEMPSFAEGEAPRLEEGEAPEDFAGGSMSGESRGFAGQEQDVTEEEETTASNKVSLSELDSSVWIWLGISAAVVIAGLLTAFFYRRGRL